jgi:UDP-N-acetylmuramoyl-tripeptide--D-alanyl-D-alanine ligase
LDLPSLYELYLSHPNIRTDTRKLVAGDIFFALKGPSFDGNAFASRSLELGASYAVIDDRNYWAGPRTILVDDVLETLQQLARYHRDQLHIPCIAITGSNGKTTTKELVRDVLRTTHTTYATAGNLNNHIGVPLTLLAIRADAQIAVIEMGANHQQEIAGYCRIADPTHGLITNIGKAHLEGFGGLEGVKKGKGELFDHLRQRGGTAFACQDFDYFEPMTHGIPEVHWYGTTGGEVRGSIRAKEPLLTVETDYTGTIRTHLIGDYNLYNILAAVSLGKYFGVPPARVAEAIAAYTPANARSQLIHRHGNTFILDAYNANPSSMQAAIENFAAGSAPGKILLLGAMRELGKDSQREHQKIVELIGRYRWEQVVLVGGDFAATHHPYLYFPDVTAARQWLRAQSLTGHTFLVKGSRAIAMEKILD